MTARTRLLNALRLGLGAVAWLTAIAANAAAAPAAGEARPRVALEERVSDPPVLDGAANAPVIVRIALDGQQLQPDAQGRYRFDALDARLALYRDRRVDVWVAVDGMRATMAMTDEGWRRAMQALASHLKAPARIVELTIPPDATDATALAFQIKQAAVELRGAQSGLAIAIGLPPAGVALEGLYTPDLAPYVDAVVAAPSSAPAAEAEASGALSSIRALLDRVDPTAQVYERGVALAGAPAEAARAFASAALWRLGGPSVLAAFRVSSADAARAVVRQADALRALLDGDIAPLDERAANLAIEPAATRHALIYNLTTFGTYLIYGGTGADNGTVRVSLTIASGARPRVRDPYTGAVTPVADFARDEPARRTTFTAPLRGQPLVIDFNDAVDGVITERSDVSGTTELSVDEIVARHQQAQAAQDAAIQRYTAAVRMEQHFRPSAADAGYDIVTENRFFVDDESIEWEELSFSVNGATWKANRPAFPMLQPEKVLAVPLKLRLSADYRYRLDGRQAIDGHPCYVVHFDPVTSAVADPKAASAAGAGGASMYRGTVWIDTRTFVRRKLQTVQTRLTAPIVSNEETHEFAELAPIDGHPILLPGRVSAKQILLIAGRNVLLEKMTTFADYRINGSGFQEGRAAARASDHIMYRDTDHGVRYLVKDGQAGGGRIVSEQMTSRAKAMAMGVNIDPSYDFPLPIFGINYLDFNVRGTDSQLAILFAGVLALGNIQKPRLFGTKLDGSLDFFGIAVPGNDRIYDAAGNRKQDELLNWPESVGANLGYQFTSFQKITGQYQFLFNGYAKNRETTEDYHVPSSTFTHGFGLAYEYRRAGYSLVANGTWYGRMSWKPWGQADDVQTTPRTYQKYSLSLSKDWYVGLFQKVHANGAYFGGRDLDRFSQYQFGMFDDTRIHGVPSAGVRYGEMAMARGSYSFNLLEQYRFDLFLEQAFARDRALSHDWDPVTGLGVAFTVKAPFDTLLRADVGKAFLPDRYRATGSTVVSVLFLKPL